MTRTHRGRMLNLGILFLIYSVIRTYSVAETTGDVTIQENTNNGGKENTPTMTPSTITTTTTTVDPASTTLKSNESTSEATTTASNNASDANVTTTVATLANTRPTINPLRPGCHPPAIEQFPAQPFGPSFRKHGGLIIHIIIAILTFLGLAIVCDDYFVASLDRICEGLFSHY